MQSIDKILHMKLQGTQGTYGEVEVIVLLPD